MVAGQVEQFIIKPLAHVAQSLGNAVKHASFRARLSTETRIVNVDILPDYNEELGGYEVIVDVREPGVYYLEVYMHWVYADGMEREGE